MTEHKVLLVCKSAMICDHIFEMISTSLDIIVSAPRDSQEDYLGRIYSYTVSDLGSGHNNTLAKGTQVHMLQRNTASYVIFIHFLYDCT